jgi:DNA (cytosine-5)-methyltransferase 1
VSITITDLFCGAGGSSLGAELAGATLRLGLNHWDRAVETHSANFEHADHDCEDIASLTTAQIRRYPDSDILLASPECTNHSLAKGAQRRKPQAPSLFDDGPAGDAEQDRSRATMWDVPRFTEQKLLKGRPYKAIVVENVVDAFKWGSDDDGGLFNAWLQAMRALGYEHEIVWLNSMFAHGGATLVPQSRDRMYIVFWRRGMRAPNLRFEPLAWCPHCSKVVAGQQRWKKPGARVWGRYGAQYLYGCPDCHGIVLPAAAPAATIIDELLPAVVIGERKRPLAPNTRERIRRGLERLEREPFAIRLTHGGIPRPLTLPLVTLTQRHDPAMVFPVAGNTHETSPGNRAKRSDRDPLATVHGTADRALVVPPMGSVEARPAGELPAPTQTTTTRAAVVHPRGVAELQRHGDVRPIHEPVHTVRAGGQHHGLVMANREHGVPRPAALEPAQTACTGHGCGLAVVSHYDPGWTRRAGDEPTGSVTTRDGHSIVVPYNRTGQAVDAHASPARTLTARDRLALVVPYATGNGALVAGEQPTATLTSRDKHAVVWTDDDIDACRFRMFALHEIAGAMAMQEHVDGGEYLVIGNKRERMAQYGNAVTPPAMALIVGRLLEVVA